MYTEGEIPQDVEFQPLYKKWAVKKLAEERWEKVILKEEDIDSVSFEVIYGGYCETCQYTSFGAKVKLNDGTELEIETYDDSATETIRELLALKMEMPA